MYSDVISDCISSLEEELNPDYAYPEIYFPKEVIKMFAQMHYVRMLSDTQLPYGYAMTFKEMKKKAKQLAIETYNKNMKSKKQTAGKKRKSSNMLF